MWSAGGVANFGLAEQGFHDVRLGLSTSEVRGRGGGQLADVTRIRLRHMVFDVAVEQFYRFSSGAYPGIRCISILAPFSASQSRIIRRRCTGCRSTIKWIFRST